MLAVPTVLFITMQIPYVQTFAASKTAELISGNLNAEVKIGKVYYSFFSKVVIKDISITSPTPMGNSDTLLHCGTAYISIKPMTLIKMQPHIDRAILKNGIFNVVTEGDDMTNISRIFGTSENKKDKKPFFLTADKFRLENFRFGLTNKLSDTYGKYDGNTINFSDLELEGIYVDIRDIIFKGNTLTADIRNITALDKSGYYISRLSGQASVSANEAKISNLTIRDNYSYVKALYYSMKYNSVKDFSDYIHSVRMSANFSNTKLDMRTIGYMAPSLKDCNIAMFITGQVDGTVDNMKAGGLHVSTVTGQTLLTLNASLKGLPDTQNTEASVTLLPSHIMTADLIEIIEQFGNTAAPAILKNTNRFDIYEIDGTLKGKLLDFRAKTKIKSNHGRIRTNIRIDISGNGKGPAFDGKVSTRKLDLAYYMNDSRFGKVTMNTDLKADLTKGKMAFDIRSFHADRIDFNGYSYSNIEAKAKYDKKHNEGFLTINDSNLKASIQGMSMPMDIESSGISLFANIDHADLAKLNFNKKDTLSVLKTGISANFTVSENMDVFGFINITGTEYEDSYNKYRFGDIIYNSSSNSGEYQVSLKSPFAEMTYNADAPLSRFIGNLKSNLLRESMPVLLPASDRKIEENRKYSMKIKLLETDPVFEIFFPQVRISPDTHIEIYTKDSSTDIKIQADSIKYGKVSLENLNIRMKEDSVITCNVGSRKMKIGNFTVSENTLLSKLHNNTIDLNYSFFNKKDARGNTLSAEMFLSSRIEKDSVSGKMGIYSTIRNSSVTFNDDIWVLPESRIDIHNNSISVKDFNFSNKNQKLHVDGILSENTTDSMTVHFDRFDISILNTILNNKFDFGGKFTGNAVISDRTNPDISMGIKGNDVFIGGTPVGDLSLYSSRDSSKSKFLIGISTRLDGRKPLDITGTYNPSDNNLELKASLDSLYTSYFSPFLETLLTGLGGSVSGDFTISGPPDRLEVNSSNIMLNDMKFKLLFTQVEYTVSGPGTMDKNGLYLNNVLFKDKKGNKGYISGGLNYDSFKNMKLNTNLRFNNMLCMDTKESDNSSFYGTVYGTGALSIKGPFDNIVMNADVSTNPRSSFHIPLSSSSTASEGGILKFVDSRASENMGTGNTTAITKKSKLTQNQSGIRVLLNAKVNPEAEIQIEIDKSLGDILKTNGNGNVSIDVDTRNDKFNIFGNYIVESGSYRFVILGFTAKDFTLEQGGQINFNGDIMRTNLDLTATYKTKASLNTLTSDTSSVSSRRNVNCEIKMSGSLMSPELKFGIDIPDLEPTTKARVESALSSDDKIQKQFASLLVSGNFVPDEQSSIVDNSSLLYSTASEMISSQFNNIFRQLDIPLDLGFNYQPGEAKGQQDVFDVAVSTQLFNNRVVVNGTIGNGQYDKSNSVVGDIDIEIKLEKKGRLRLNLFSHSTDQYSNYLDDSQRQGIGIIYQEEFNTFRELFRRIFWSKKRKEAFQQQALQEFIEKKSNRSRQDKDKKQQ